MCVEIQNPASPPPPTFIWFDLNFLIEISQFGSRLQNQHIERPEGVERSNMIEESEERVLSDSEKTEILSESVLERGQKRITEKNKHRIKKQRQGKQRSSFVEDTDSLDVDDDFSQDDVLSQSLMERGQQRVTEKYKNLRKLSRQGSLSKKIPRLSTTISEADSLDTGNNDVLSSSVMKRAHQRDAERYKHLLNQKPIPSTVQEPIPNEDDDGKEQPQLNTVVNKSVSKYSSGSSTGDDSVFHSTPQRPGRLTRDSTIGITPIVKECPVSKRLTMVPEKSFEGLTKSRPTDGGSSSHVSRHVEGDDNDRRKILEILEGEDNDDDNRGKIPEIVEGDDDDDQGNIPEILPSQTKKKLTASEVSLRLGNMYGTSNNSSRTFVGSNRHSSISSEEGQAVLPNPCSDRNTVEENSKSSQETSVVFSQLSTGDSSNRENSKSSSVQLFRLKSKTTLKSSPESSLLSSKLSTNDVSGSENLQPSDDPLALDDQQSSRNDSSSRKSPSTSSKESTPELQSGSVQESLVERKDEQGDDDTILLNESTNPELAEISEGFEQQYWASQNTLKSSNKNPGSQQQSTQNTPCNSQLYSKIQTESYEGLPVTLTLSESMESLDNSDLDTNTHQQQSVLFSTSHLRTMEPKTYEEMLAAALACSNSIDACDIDRYDVLWNTECPMSGARRQLKTVCLLPILCLPRVKIPERLQQKQNSVQHDKDSSDEMTSSPPPKKKRFTLGRNNSTVTPSRIYGSVMNYFTRTSSQSSSSSKQSSQRSIVHNASNRDLVMSQNIVEEELSAKEEPDIPSQGIGEDLLDTEGNVSLFSVTGEILDNSGQQSQTKFQPSPGGENIDGEKERDNHDELYCSMEDENEKLESLGTLKGSTMQSHPSTTTSNSSLEFNKSSVTNVNSVKDKSHSENIISHSSNANKSVRQSSKSSNVVSQPTTKNISKGTLGKRHVVESEHEGDHGQDEHKNEKTINDRSQSKIPKKKSRRVSPLASFQQERNQSDEVISDTHEEANWNVEDEAEKTGSLGSLKEPTVPSCSSTEISKSSLGTNKPSVTNASSLKANNSFSEHMSSTVNESVRLSSKSSNDASQQQTTTTNFSKRTLGKKSVVESSSEKEVDPGREDEHKNKKTRKTKISDPPLSRKKKTNVLKKKTRRRSPSISSPVGSSSSSEPSLIPRVDTRHIGKSRRGKKTLAELQDNSNMVSKDYLIEVIRERGLTLSDSELDSFHDFLNKELESLCNALCQQAARPYGMFTYRQLEDAFKQKKLVDPSLGKNGLMIMFASILPHSVYQRAKGVLIPKEGQRDTFYND